MKRFTETTKWRDPWFRKLSTPARLAWLWILDHCDNSGVIELDLEVISFDVGELVNEQHITELASRLHSLSDVKTLIPKFVPFQFGTLKDTNPLHTSVLRLQAHHNITDTLSVSFRGCQAPVQGLPSPLSTRKERNGMVKEGNKGVQGGFQKPSLESVKLHSAKIGMSDVEAEKFFNYYESNGWKVGKNPMRSWIHAMANWKSNVPTYSASTGSGPSLNPMNIKTIIQAKQTRAAEIRTKFCSDTAMDSVWSDPKKRQEFFDLKREVKELNLQLSNMA